MLTLWPGSCGETNLLPLFTYDATIEQLGCGESLQAERLIIVMSTGIATSPAIRARRLVTWD